MRVRILPGVRFQKRLKNGVKNHLSGVFFVFGDFPLLFLFVGNVWVVCEQCGAGSVMILDKFSVLPGKSNVP
ncbi:MAG: hypothetical protein DA446_09250 [Bacteroidetes bacterium]|nr:MAG: hypothetical protein DA446_09250 [Bacteroidota bacterium]